MKQNIWQYFDISNDIRNTVFIVSIVFCLTVFLPILSGLDLGIVKFPKIPPALKSKFKWISVITFTILIILSVFPIFPQNNLKQKVSITVVDQDNFPIKNAKVRKEGSLTISITNADGIVMVDSNDLTKVFIIYHPDYQPFRETLAGLTASLNKR